MEYQAFQHIPLNKQVLGVGFSSLQRLPAPPLNFLPKKKKGSFSGVADSTTRKGYWMSRTGPCTTECVPS